MLLKMLQLICVLNTFIIIITIIIEFPLFPFSILQPFLLELLIFLYSIRIIFVS